MDDTRGSMIEYRKATINDIDLLAKIRVYFLCEGKDTSNDDIAQLLINIRKYFYSAMIKDSFVSWIALSDGEIIATSGLTIYMVPPNLSCPTGKTAYISNMFTYPKFRKQGIATKLFSLTMDEAVSRGCTRILLNATDMGRPIYERYGFEDAESSMAYYATV